MTSNIIPFNPLDKRNLGASVADTLLAREIFPLSDIPEFEGSGIFTIPSLVSTSFETVERSKSPTKTCLNGVMAILPRWNIPPMTSAVVVDSSAKSISIIVA